jgi:hypothetical protein
MAARPIPNPLRDDTRRSFMRALTCMVQGSAERGQMARGALRVLERNFKYDSDCERLLKGMVKAPVPPMDTTYAPSGGSMQWPAISVWEGLPLLAPQAASTQVLGAGVGLSLDQINSLHLPFIPQSGRPTPIFVAEGAAMPVPQMTVSDQILGPTKKILVQVALTNELQVVSAYTAERMLSEALTYATESALDAALFSSAASTAAAPQGILHGLTALVPTATGTKQDMAATDLGNLAEAIANAGIAVHDLLFVTSPREETVARAVLSPKFNNVILSSASIATGTVIAIAPKGLYTGYAGDLVIEINTESTTHFESTTPAQNLIGGTPGAPVPAVPTYSMFQMDMIAIKLRARCAWQVQPGAVAYVQSVNW